MQRCGAEVFPHTFLLSLPFPHAPIPINALYALYQCLGGQEGERRRLSLVHSFEPYV
ncbi:hypothetical protein NEUTE1DRAFT_94001 [Neurospora tetrasperma FGSC 2508]|uniref:Uncharacterized protein n=1 Tax=Neurospora tetrasperma (strain FGSC 2508 / ATCC MYA-4615 / P0657) TaxID=510951 RepID=F8MDG5_NEUT8|nr:uncharacterized protein NEUTE1DRAFT_94001 [Neurospora tetrasperma FGSC 2508]EGO61456.1 hypothetical protein NEUTE1DRAFT_94001 [Neurospora tetrasperma FGSC 2508]EGZ74513.1 hypothetical protein NEUTE2DRAFT_120009 [Neurospora tetrasperma FGSC 2509]